MSNASFDPQAVSAAYLSAIAPARQAQQESFKSVERFARFQYAVAGDCLESGLAQLGAALIATTPADLLASQSALSRQFGAKLRERAQEFVELASEFQGMLRQAAAVAVAAAKAPQRAP